MEEPYSEGAANRIVPESCLAPPQGTGRSVDRQKCRSHIGWQWCVNARSSSSHPPVSGTGRLIVSDRVPGRDDHACAACKGSGKNRDLRSFGLLVLSGSAALLIQALFEYVLPARGHGAAAGVALVAETVTLVALRLAQSCCVIYTAVALFRFVTGRCARCGGSGRTRRIPRETPFLSREDRERLEAHGCRHCGYDLTGNESGVCPECGTPQLKA